MNPRVRASARDIGLDVLSILAVGIFVFPIIWLFLTALKPSGQMFEGPLAILPHSITLDNFARIWNAVGFQTAFRNSLIVSTSSALIVTIVGLCAAYSLSRFRYRLRSLFAGGILAVQMLPGIVIVVPLIVILRSVGLTDRLAGLIVVYLLIGLPIAVWMLKGYMDDIPAELDEAATIDGASSLQVLWQIVMPLMAPATVAVGAFAFLLAWGEYLFAVALITSTEMKTLPLALQAAFGQYSIDWGMLTAGGVIISLPPAVLFLFFQRYLVGGLTTGGVKG
ncbi:MAG: carbohydrate ABC transporter permease [Thermomicrobiales bacterium]|nr:carbohydrate ABC transporter permease [Thermomicrobiales bacterium]